MLLTKNKGLVALETYNLANWYFWLVIFLFTDETKEYFGLLIGPHVSAAVFATSHVAMCYLETGKTPLAANHVEFNVHKVTTYLKCFRLLFCTFTPFHDIINYGSTTILIPKHELETARYEPSA